MENNKKYFYGEFKSSKHYSGGYKRIVRVYEEDTSGYWGNYNGIIHIYKINKYSGGFRHEHFKWLMPEIEFKLHMFNPIFIHLINKMNSVGYCYSKLSRKRKDTKKLRSILNGSVF